jgi:vitamin B12 transporter
MQCRLWALCSLLLVDAPIIKAQPQSQPTSKQANSPPASQPLWVDETDVSAPAPSPMQDPTGGQSYVVTPEATWGSQDNAADVLKKIPGVSIRAAGGDGQRQIVLLRGASEEQVLLLLDGIRLNEAGGGGVDLSEIPAASVARIEVVTGAAAALYGAEAMGGVILITTRSAFYQSLAEVRTSVSSLSTFRINAARIEQLGEWGIFAQLNAIESRGAFSFLDTNDQPRIRQNNDAQLLSGIIKAERLIGDRYSLSLLGKAGYSQRGIPGPEQFESITSKQEVKRVFLSAIMSDKEVSGLSSQLFASLRVGDIFFADPDPQLGLPFEANAIEVSPLLGWRFLWRSSKAQDKALGASKEDTLSRAGSQEKKLGGDFSWSYEDLFSDDLAAGEASRVRGSMALFGERSIGRFSIAPALRFEGASTFGLTPVPRLGVSFQVIDNVELKLSAGRAYRVPSLRDLFLQIDGVSGNPDLSPEDSWEISTGFSLERERITLSGSVFARDLRNVILFTQQSAFEIVAQNFSGYTTKGAELSLLVTQAPFSIEGSYARLNTQSDSGLSLPGVASDRAVARVSYQKNHWQLFSGLELQSSFFTNIHNTQEAPSRQLLSAGASFMIAEQMGLSLEGQNLLNQQRLIDALQLPLPPRVFTFTLRGIF